MVLLSQLLVQYFELVFFSRLKIEPKNMILEIFFVKFGLVETQENRV